MFLQMHRAGARHCGSLCAAWLQQKESVCTARVARTRASKRDVRLAWSDCILALNSQRAKKNMWSHASCWTWSRSSDLVHAGLAFDIALDEAAFGWRMRVVQRSRSVVKAREKSISIDRAKGRVLCRCVEVVCGIFCGHCMPKLAARTSMWYTCDVLSLKDVNRVEERRRRNRTTYVPDTSVSRAPLTIFAEKTKYWLQGESPLEEEEGQRKEANRPLLKTTRKEQNQLKTCEG